MAPMQTVQLLGREGRRGFLESARAHVAPRGLVAIALADALETFDAEHVLLPLPDTMFVDGALYSSQPVGLRDRGDSVAIERIRTILRADGTPQRQRRRARAWTVSRWRRSRPRAAPPAWRCCRAGSSRRPRSTSARAW